MDQLLLTEFSQKLLRINIQWWTEFRAALPAGLLRQLRNEATAGLRLRLYRHRGLCFTVNFSSHPMGSRKPWVFTLFEL